MSKLGVFNLLLNLLGDVVLPAEAIVHITDFVNVPTLLSVTNEALSMI